MKKLLSFLILGLVVGSLLGCEATPPTETPVQAEVSPACTGPAITLGEISEYPNEVITSMQPLADYLAEGLADFGFVCAKVKVVLTIDDMIQAIKDGEVDIIWTAYFLPP